MAVDSRDRVWVLAGAREWTLDLMRFDQPKAAGGTLLSLGNPADGVITRTRESFTGTLAVDANDNVHVLFSGYGPTTKAVFHRVYRDGWEKAQVVSDDAGGHDVTGPLAADSLGDVHLLYTNNGLEAYETHGFFYRRWRAGKLSRPVHLFSHTPLQHDRLARANANIVNVAVNEPTGDVYVVGRDLNHGGAMCLFKRPAAVARFSFLGRLTARSAGEQSFYLPRARGTVWPAFNQAAGQLHLSWMQDSARSSKRVFLGGVMP